MVISAFGIEHTEISKAFRKLHPKMGRAYMGDTKTKAHKTMDEKMRRHAVEARMASGEQGRYFLSKLPAKSREKVANQPFKMQYGSRGKTRLGALREQKVGAQGIYDAIGREGRKKKVLP